MSSWCNGTTLWDTKLTWNNAWPQFTDCFQSTVLVWVPCGWLWLTSPFYLYYLRNVTPTSLSSRYKYIAKLITCSFLVLMSVIRLIVDAHGPTSANFRAVFVAPAIQALTFLLAMLLLLLERKKGLITSGVMFTFWLMLTLAGIIPFYSIIIQEEYQYNAFQAVTFYMYFALVVLELFLGCFPESSMERSTDKILQSSCPESQASFLSRISFWWMNSLIRTGHRKALTETDVYSLDPDESSAHNVSRFSAQWNKQMERHKGREDYIKVSFSKEPKESPCDNTSDERSPLLTNTKLTQEKMEVAAPRKSISLVVILWKTFWIDLIQFQVWKVVSELLRFASPLLLRELIAFTTDKTMPSWKGFILCAVLSLSTLTQTVFAHSNWHQGKKVAVRISGAIISAIFRKSLRMSNKARKESTVGEIVNLMSVDVEHLRGFTMGLWGIWGNPMKIAIGLYLLYQSLGLSMFAGMAVLLFFIPVNTYVTFRLKKHQTYLMKWKDKRMKMMNEVLNGIKILKLYAWEPSFQEKILEIRKQEMHTLWTISLLKSITTFTWTLVPYLISLSMFTTYIYTSEDHYLRPEVVFTSISLLGVIRLAVASIQPLCTSLVQTIVSIERINKFLNTEDLNDDHISLDSTQCVYWFGFKDYRWKFSMEWKTGPKPQNINLTVEERQLVAIVGQVGSGKSSLVSAILGEMENLQGQVFLKSHVAYVPQVAWIQNDTLQNNILFGRPMDRHWYNKVVECCALTPDLEMLPAGDMTEIGERGINLSGGQKQRVSLARAVYNNADIYILDDPLSAVDSHVGKHIFDKVISRTGLLASKARVLVTHGIHWLPKVDSIIVMSTGQISETGTYRDLLHHNGPFAQFLQTYILENMDGDENDTDMTELKKQLLQSLEVMTSGDETEQEIQESAALVTSLIQSADITNPNPDQKEEVRAHRVKQKSKLIEDEIVERGKVTLSVFLAYGRAIGLLSVVFALLMYALFQAASVIANTWLSKWTDDGLLNNVTLLPFNGSARMTRNIYYLGIYGTFGLAQTGTVIIFSFVWNIRTVKASGILHCQMLTSVLRAPMSFFDTTPIGRIVNRFAQDIDSVDTMMPTLAQQAISTMFQVLSSIIVISYTTPIFLAVVFPLIILYHFIQGFYVTTSRQLKRLESKARSPIYSHFGETLSGASVIRSFQAQSRFIKESEDRVDRNQRFSFTHSVLSVHYLLRGRSAEKGTARFARKDGDGTAQASESITWWQGVRLEIIGNIIVLAASLFAVISRDMLSGGLVGLSVSYAIEITANLNYLVQLMAEVQTQVVSVERIKQYTDITSEPAWNIPERRSNHDWPDSGMVKFLDYSTRYREGLDLILKGITCTIHPREKVGIVGRTGAGKSSLTLSLFRLIEAAGGEINIDGVDVSTLGLHDLRNKLTILPQDPVLFAGSLRGNVDPFNQYSDNQIWRALEQAHLKTFVEVLSDGLEHECSEGGGNMSIGQRQLLCLARALLKKTKVLVLDEATSAVDMETDDLIQRTIRSEFKDCTVLTIAHRLNTVMDYDRILVLDNGRVCEFDTPSSLLQQPDSIFYNMAKTAGLIA